MLSVLACGPAWGQCLDYEDYIHWVGGTYLPGSVADVAVSGTTAYVANGAGGLLVIDVTNPATLSLVASLDTPGNGLGIAARGGYAYLADGTGGLQVIDVANPAAPVILGSVDTPGSAREVAISGNYAYVADLTGGLQIIDITDPAGPAVVASLVAPSPGRCEGVAVSGNTVIVTHSAYGWISSLSLWTIDITNPAAPMTIGNPTTYGEAASDIAVSDHYALVTIVPTGFATRGHVKVIDIANPLEPELIVTYPLQYSAEGVALSGSTAYVIETAVCGGSAPCEIPPPSHQSGLQVLEIANPMLPVSLGSVDVNANRVAVSGNHAYAVELQVGVHVIDVTYPAAPAVVGGIDIPQLGGSTPHSVGIAAAGERAYVSDGATLRVLDVADPTRPAIIGVVDTPGTGGGVVVSGNYVYLAGNGLGVSGDHAYTWTGLEVIDVTDPTAPLVVGHVDGGWPPRLRVVDISDPTAPVIVGAGNETGHGIDVGGVAVSGHYVYATDGWSGLYVFDVTDPVAPILTGSVDTPGRFTNRLAVAGGHAYVACEDRIQVIDIADPSAPKNIGTLATTDWRTPARIALAGGYVYVASGRFEIYPAQCEESHSPAPVALNLDPSVINLGSRARWVTAYIEAEGFDVASIDLSSVRLAGSVPVAAAAINDDDGDGTSDLTLKFTRKLLDPLLEPGWNTLEVTGSLASGETFRGADAVRVIGSPRLSAARVLHATALNPRGILTFTTMKPGLVTVKLFDVRGRLVGVPADRAFARAGTHEVRIDGRMRGGTALSSGIYFYRVETEEGIATGRIAIVR